MRLSLCLISLAALAATAADAATPPDFYTLRKDSFYETGCFGPCACPVLLRGPVKGGFRLVYLGFDGLFDHYQVDKLRWRILEPSQEVPVTGTGTYRIGGEFALQHQLTLDLQIGQDPVKRFDSGVVVPPTPFPRIDARISVNGEMTCFDQVFDLHARRTRGLDVDASSLWWEPAPPADGHDIVHGSLLGLRTGGLAGSVRGCLARGTTADWMTFSPTPPPGEGYWFLLRDVEGNLEGSYDSGGFDQIGSRDDALGQSAIACP
jgi:hypothetical protein